MKKLFIFFILLICLFSSSSWAIDCYQNNYGGDHLVTTSLPPFTVPADAPVGKKIWESGDITVTVYCDEASHNNKDPKSPWSENVYAYILDSFHNTDNLVTNNSYLAFGVTYNGVDYDIPNTKINTGACLDQMSDFDKSYKHKACNGHTIQKNTTFTVRFRLYVKLKSIPPSQIEYNFPAVTVLAFDGSGGINRLAHAKNLHYDIDGLSNIHFLDCSVDIKIYPESQIVDFGQISDSVILKEPAKKPFSISTIKNEAAGCTDKFDVKTSFYTNDTLYDNTHLDMGNGLLMRINDKTINSDIVYNQYANFASYIPGSAATVTHNYIAELTKHPTKSLVEGPFSKDLIIKINYQ
ncbi:pilus assembly protein [Klebsiella michiganensis]|uniref:pilus assembly protein n=1 Tax=Klebsiella michiganensis TaxID=1134687 RepID=UPI00292BEA49|nr:pilus assembly protein [Klebsiella michiganensis]MDV1541154.1 pilus assembly protein [Klebsiella michiganensis]MDV1552334.1 pilus assembly protein [Klebsiella michiganensis]